MLPNASNDELMFVASRNCCPTTPDFLMRSEPARSTTVSLPNTAFISTFFAPFFAAAASLARGLFATLIWNTA